MTGGGAREPFLVCARRLRVRHGALATSDRSPALLPRSPRTLSGLGPSLGSQAWDASGGRVATGSHNTAPRRPKAGGDTGRGPAPHQALRASPASPHPVVLKRLRGLPLQARSKAVLGPGALGTGSPVSSSHDTEPRGQHSCKRRSNTRVPSKAHLRPWGRPSPPWGLRGLSTVLTRDMNVVRDPRQAGCCTGRPSEFGGPPAPSQLPTVGGWFTLSLVTPSKTLTCQLPSPLGEVG